MGPLAQAAANILGCANPLWPYSSPTCGLQDSSAQMPPPASSLLPNSSVYLVQGLLASCDRPRSLPLDPPSSH